MVHPAGIDDAGTDEDVESIPFLEHQGPSIPAIIIFHLSYDLDFEWNHKLIIFIPAIIFFICPT